MNKASKIRSRISLIKRVVSTGLSLASDRFDRKRPDVHVLLIWHTSCRAWGLDPGHSGLLSTKPRLEHRHRRSEMWQDI